MWTLQASRTVLQQERKCTRFPSICKFYCLQKNVNFRVGPSGASGYNSAKDAGQLDWQKGFLEHHLRQLRFRTPHICSMPSPTTWVVCLRFVDGRREKEQKSIARGTHSPGRPERRGRRGRIRRAFQGINLHGSNNKRVAPRSPILV